MPNFDIEPNQNPKARGVMSFGVEGVEPQGMVLTSEGDLTLQGTLTAGTIAFTNNSAPALGIYYPNDPQYGYVSGTDITTSGQNALNAMPTSGAFRGGKLIVPKGSWTLTTAWVIKSGVRIDGMSRLDSRLNGTGAGVITWTADLNNVVIENLNLVCSSGHVFAPSGGAADWGWYTSTVRQCNLTVTDVNGSIVNHVSNRDYDNVQFLECDLTRGAGSLAPGFNIVNGGGAANQNTWRDCWAHSSNSTGAPMFHVESTSTGNYAYNNVFENITGEQCAGGLIRLLSNHSPIIKNCFDYDTVATYTTDIIQIGKSAVVGGLPSLNPHIEVAGRRDNVTLPAGIYDINLVPNACKRAFVSLPNHSSSKFKMNWQDADGHRIFGMIAGGGPAAQPSDATDFLQTTKVQTLYIGNSVSGTSKKTVGTGSPEGVVSGSIGDEYNRLDGSGGDVLYVKRSGTATTTGWASTGRPLPTAYTPSGGRRLLSGWPFPSAIGTFSLAKDTWRYSPLALTKDLSVSFLSVLCSVAPTGGTGVMIFGLWVLDANGKPSTRQADWATYGSIDLTVGAGGESTLATAGLVIPAGDWAIGCAWTGTAATSPTMFATTGTHPSVASNSIAQQTSAYSQAVSGASTPSPAVPAAAAAQGVAIYGVM